MALPSFGKFLGSALSQPVQTSGQTDARTMFLSPAGGQSDPGWQAPDFVSATPDLPAHVVSTLNQIAGQSKSSTDAEEFLTQAMQGRAPAEILRQREIDAKKELALQIAQDAGHMDDAQLDRLTSEMRAEMDGAPTFPVRAQGNPSALQTGLAAVASMLDPRHAFELGASAYAAAGAQAERDFADARQKYAADMAAHQERLRALGGMVDDAHQTRREDLGNAQWRASLLERSAADAQKALDHAIDLRHADERDAWVMFRTANTAAEAEAGASRLAALGRQLPPDVVEEQKRESSIRSRQYGESLYRQTIRPFEEAYGGAIPDEFAGELEARRKAIERQYGIPLPPLRTASYQEQVRRQKEQRQKSELARQRHEEYRAMLPSLDDNARANLAAKWAGVDIARQRVEAAQASLAISAKTRDVRVRMADIAAASLELRKAEHMWRTQAGVARSSARSEIEKLKARRKGLVGRLKGAKGSGFVRAKIDADIQSTDAQIRYLQEAIAAEPDLATNPI